MSQGDAEIQEIVQSFPIVPAKLQENSRVVYRASAGCADRRGYVLQVHETTINYQQGFTYTVRLDPIVVEKQWIKDRCDGFEDGKCIPLHSLVVFKEQEVWNDDVPVVCSKISQAMVMESSSVCDRYGMHRPVTYKIQISNVRAQNDMIRKEEFSDTIDVSDTTLKQSTSYWDEDAAQTFHNFSEYIANMRLAINNAKEFQLARNNISRNHQQLAYTHRY